MLWILLLSLRNQRCHAATWQTQKTWFADFVKADFWGAETFSLFNCTVVLCVLKGWNRLCRFWDWPHGQRGSSSDASVRRPKTPQWCSFCNFLTYFIMSYDFLLDSISSWMYFYFAGKCFCWLYNTDLLKLPSKCFLQINVNNVL